MCWRLNCPFRTRRLPDETDYVDEITNILIFGITGMTGGAVLDATLGCAWFKVNGLTRSKEGNQYNNLVAKGVKLFTGDMNKPQTLNNAMKGIDTVFLVTAYWDSRSVEKEYNQGVNVVNVAIENAVKHLIYVGTDYSIFEGAEKCGYLESKAMVENYIVSVGIPFTVVHLGFYFENLLSVFRPYRVGKNDFAIALPMDKVALNCGSVYDFGFCIGKIALQRHSYLFRTIKLATAYLTVSDIAFMLSDHFNTARFYNPRITLADYGSLDLAEAKELVSIFEHYQRVPEWDRSQTYSLYPSWRSFEKWIKDCDKDLLSVMYRRNYTQVPASDHLDIEWRSVSTLGSRFLFGPFKRFMSTKDVSDIPSVSSATPSTISSVKEKQQSFARRAALKNSNW